MKTLAHSSGVPLSFTHRTNQYQTQITRILEPQSLHHATTEPQEQNLDEIITAESTDGAEVLGESKKDIFLQMSFDLISIT